MIAPRTGRFMAPIVPMSVKAIMNSVCFIAETPPGFVPGPRRPDRPQLPRNVGRRPIAVPRLRIDTFVRGWTRGSAAPRPTRTGGRPQRTVDRRRLGGLDR